MCYIDVDDGEPCEVWHEATHRARKDHHCDCCGRTIKPGETYTKHFSVFRSCSPNNEKICAECFEDRRRFSDAHRVGDFVPSDFTEWLVNCISDGDEESDRVWKPMLEGIRARRAAA